MKRLLFNFLKSFSLVSASQRLPFSVEDTKQIFSPDGLRRKEYPPDSPGIIFAISFFDTGLKQFKLLFLSGIYRSPFCDQNGFSWKVSLSLL